MSRRRRTRSDGSWEEHGELERARNISEEMDADLEASRQSAAAASADTSRVTVPIAGAPMAGEPAVIGHVEMNPVPQAR